MEERKEEANVDLQLTPSSSTHNMLSAFLTPPYTNSSTPCLGDKLNQVDLEPLEVAKIDEKHSASSTGNEFIYDKVSNIVNSVYEQLDKMIQIHGENAVKDIMPIIVNILGKIKSVFNFLIFYLV